MSTPVLEVRNLATHFFTRAGVVKAVDGISFKVDAGKVMGLVGESGSGKSITGFSLIGLIDEPGRIVSGSVKLNGVELIGLPSSELRKLRGSAISMVFQDPMMTLNPLLTIGRQMYLALSAHEKLSEKASRSRCIEALSKVGIPDAARRLDAYPHQFSGGMRQRVAIAIALLHRPSVVIADEPTTALDVSIQAQILAEMKALVRDFGTALIWISHDLATVSSIADDICVMYTGRMAEYGPAAPVLRSPYHPYTQGLLDSLPSCTQPGEELRQIPGTTPSLLKLPPGCAFAPRCSRATEHCQIVPDEVVQGARQYRCHHPLTEIVP